ncbi:MAG: porin, partial [bacterium]
MHQNLLTSFTGKDLLYTRLNSGNAKSSSLGGNPFNLLILDKITTPRASPNILEIMRPYYRFPMG